LTCKYARLGKGLPDQQEVDIRIYQTNKRITSEFTRRRKVYIRIR